MKTNPYQLILFFVLIALINKAQVYTVSLQNNNSDAFVASASATANFGDAETIKISRNEDGTIERSLIKFDLSTLQPGVDILSAKLILYGINHETSNPGGAVLQMVPQFWKQETVTWNYAENFKNSGLPAINLVGAASSTENYTLDVKDMVQTMVNSPLINFGWLLYMDDESNINTKYFEFGAAENSDRDMRPKLEITYCKHLSINAYVSPSSAGSTGDAGVYLSVSEGVPPYSYAWSNAATTKDIYNVAPGLYEVTVTDARLVSRSVLVPVTSECGTLTYTLNASPAEAFNSARLLSNSSDPNTANTNYQNASDIKAYFASTSGTNTIARSLLAFDISSLPNNIQVNQANLILTDNEPTHNQTYKVQLARAIGVWNERTVNYGNKPDYITESNDLIEFDYDGSQSTYNLDVTAQLQKMVSEVGIAKGWMLKLKDETTTANGNSVSFNGLNAGASSRPTLVVQVTSNNLYCDDNLLNWTEKTSYNENGNAINVAKTYADNLGRVTQALLKNATNEVFTTLNLYDGYGRTAIVTKPAFTGNQLKFYPGFMRNQTGQMYGLNDFDTPGTLNNPNALQNGIVNTLGNYYSNNNPYDPYQATADNPYTRVEYASDGNKKRVSQPGNAFKMGSGNESYGFSMVSGDELKFIFGNNTSYKATRNNNNTMDCTPLNTGENIVAVKEINASPGNPETITYRAGGKLIATCYNGLDLVDVCNNITAITSVMYYNGTMSRDIHLPKVTSLVLPLPQQLPNNINTVTNVANISYKIIDLYTERELVLNADYSFSATRQVIFSPAFLALYAGKSLFLRISFQYDAAYVASLPGLYGISQPVDPVIIYDLPYGRFSKNYYDLNGAIRKSVSPKGMDYSNPANIIMATTYDYNHYGQVIAVKSPDEGLKEMVYNDEGNLRFTQNSEQKLNNRFSYVNYDKHARPYESGECQSSNANGSVWFSNYYNSAIPGSPGILPANLVRNFQDGLLPTDKTNVTRTGYTLPATTDDIPTTYANYNQYRGFRNGQVNFIKNNNSTIWYNYDKLGRSLATISQITETDFVAKTNSVNDRIKTVDGTYNYFTGLPTTSTYQAGTLTEQLQYQFSYDANYRPANTQLSFGVGTPQQLSTCSYNKSGALKRVVIGNNYQGMDFVYTLNGGLKAINHPGLDSNLDPGHDAADYSGNASGVNKDLFGEIIEYYNNDYLRSNTNMGTSISVANSKFNGLIQRVRYKTRAQVNSTNTGADYIDYGGSSQSQNLFAGTYSQQELAFEYSYDKFGQLATSSFGTFNNAAGNFTQRSEYAETGLNGGNIGYDKNGNISRLERRAYTVNNSTVLMDNLTYNVGFNTNRLNIVTDNGSGALAAGFPNTTAYFTYNSIGQMTQSPAENISNITYYPSGKVKQITFNNGNTTDYEYGANGQKLKSKFYNATANKNKYTWYVGPYIYEWDEAAANAFEIKEVQVQGGAIRVIGGADINTGYLVYYVTDHLGNIRATYKAKSGTNQSGTGIDILSYSDYYAFGGQLPGRQWAAEDCRYAYQGQEKKDATNPWSQFELRMYNTDLGRWFAPDPYGQFASPYLAMGNNPVSNTDPDGGWVNAAPGEGRRFLGAERDRADRLAGRGAYSSTEIQKRFEEEYKQLREHFLNLKHSSWNTPFNQKQGNIGEYLNSIMALNNWYSGLAASCNSQRFGGTSGLDYLTQSQIGLNAAKASDAGEQEKALSGGYEAQQRISTAEDPGANQVICTMDNYSGARHLVKKSGHEWYMKGDGGGRYDGRSQTTTYSDGTTVTSLYDKDGNVINSTVGYDASADNHIQNMGGGGNTSIGNEALTLPNLNTNLSNANIEPPNGVELELSKIMNMKDGEKGDYTKLFVTLVSYVKKGSGVIVKLSAPGELALKATRIKNANGAFFSFSKFKVSDTKEAIRIQSEQATFDDKPLDIFINNSSYGIPKTNGNKTSIEWYKIKGLD